MTEQKAEIMRLSGAILAGGRSNRMGQPKESIRLPDGRTMLETVSDRIARICPVKIISGETVCLDGALNVTDRIWGLGPIAGIEAILASGVSERYLIAACDQPLLSEGVLERLVNESRAPIVVPCDANGFRYPLPGVYDRSILELVRERIKTRELALMKLLTDAGARTIDVSEADEASLRSFNTPEELVELFEMLKAKQ